ncbi:hypothetical protein [Roseibium sp.]|uniref:hypothetical protein n=1 Tax=Roseibium sp. TaxID=1936156 RepID=UPI003266C8F9
MSQTLPSKKFARIHLESSLHCAPRATVNATGSNANVMSQFVFTRLVHKSGAIKDESVTETFHKRSSSRKANGQHSNDKTTSHSSGLPGATTSCQCSELVDVAVKSIMTILGFARSYPIEEIVKLSERLEAALVRLSDENSPELTAIARQIDGKALVLNVMQSMLEAELIRVLREPNSPINALRPLASEFDKECHAKRSELLSIQDQLHEAIPREIWPYVHKALHRNGDLDTFDDGQRH